MKKIIISIVVVLIVIVAGFYLYISLTWDDPFEAEYPVISASTDSSVIARGKYLAYGPGHCVFCHVPPEKLGDVAAGKEVPLTGGGLFDIPPGKFRTPNLTPDIETGIGKLTDAEIARALRFSVNHRNFVMVPFMAFQDASDSDLMAIISFLRSQQPVRNVVEPSEYTFLGKAIVAFGLLKPVGPNGIPPKSVVIDSTAAYGSYIAHSVANCVGCHTARDMKTGEFTGPLFAGGMKFEPDAFSQGYSFISPNLTPDKETGVMKGWNESAFIDRFQGGRVVDGSPMPWEAFQRMNESDLKALWKYFESLDPVYNEIRQTVYGPGEKLPD